MATTTKKPSKTAAAKAEKEPTERIIEWEGQTLTLPAIPAWDEIMADLALVRTSDDPSVALEMLISMIGEDQYRVARKTLKANDKNLVEGLSELIAQIFEEYGTSEGESGASQNS
jgi:hypothetical protein